MRRSLQIRRILVIDRRNYGKTFKRYYLKNGDCFLQFLLYFRNLQKILLNLKEKDHLHSLTILEVIALDKCGYFIARKLLF